MKLLAGDIGGTTSRFQWFNSDGPDHLSNLYTYPSFRFPSFSELLATLLVDSGVARADVACLGLPGPVSDVEVALTNLPWRINAHELEQQRAFGRVTLVNDFYAAALGIDCLTPDEVICLHPGNYDPQGNRLVVGAGTGLGVAPVCQQEGQFLPQSSEGGHLAFAPLSELQNELLAWMQQSISHVTYEHLLSGGGLQRLYHFYCQRHVNHKQVDTLTAAEIHRQAEMGDQVAASALSTFVTIYGQFIADATLLWPARAGIYIAGGIAAKIVNWMQSDDFLSSFLATKPMHDLVRKMPVYLVKDEFLGLKGALLMARRLAGLPVDQGGV